MINTKIQDALVFAAEKHKNQTRKGTDIPYIVHPAECMQILTKLKCSENVIIAGILHDTLEDTDTTYNELVEKFNKEIADLVMDVSEQDKTLSWQERKDAYFKHLRNCQLESRYVCFADKLANLRSIYADYLVVGNNVWKKFNADKNCQKWFYTTVYNLLKTTKVSFSKLFIEYGELLDALFLS